MARGVNKAIIVGNVGQDPELKYTASGTAIANLSIATTYERDGNKQTEWHRIVLFGKTAEVANQYVRKGSQVYIEGRIQTRKWQDQSGADRYSTEIVAHEMQMLGAKEKHDDTDHRAPAKEVQEPAAATAPVDDGFDDIPF